ncbi:hypothetical protein [Klebsiella quasipneumoniae]|uniref:hypothetical protein n=1 Tax=Klebsiella quasipneumoniae TaxID=1463165 RepID=UPI00352B4BB4
MTPEQFAYWLQGYAEISGKQPTESEWQVIKDHLQTVFNKVTPDRLGGQAAAPTKLDEPLKLNFEPVTFPLRITC